MHPAVALRAGPNNDTKSSLGPPRVRWNLLNLVVGKANAVGECSRLSVVPGGLEASDNVGRWTE